MGEETIRVCIRQRPLFSKERDAGHKNAWELDPKGELTLKLLPEVDEGTSMGMRAAISRTKKKYFFDRCFDENWHNDTVYNETAKDIILDTLKGISGCYIAYGQTGCGKTHSIMGSVEDPGILPRSLADLFDVIKHGEPDAEDGTVTEFMLRISYLEIYKERVSDLFDFENEEEKYLDVKEDPKSGFFVDGLKEINVTEMGEVLELLSKAERKRHFAATNFNETSSRSHVVFTCILERAETLPTGEVIARRGELKLVDLAGNERVGELSISGDPNAKARMAEGQAINRSLFLLSEVISKLSKKGTNKDVFIPWRDSKLTRILQKALGGNSRACLLVAIHPSTQAMEITLSTLRFASKSKKISKKIEANFLSPEQSLIANQKDEITRLKEELELLRMNVDPELLQNLPLTQERRDELLQRGQLVAGHPVAPAELPNHIVELQAQLEEKVQKLHRIILEKSTFSRDASPAISTTSVEVETWAAERTDHIKSLMRLGTISSSPYELKRKQKKHDRRSAQALAKYAQQQAPERAVAAFELHDIADHFHSHEQFRRTGTITIEETEGSDKTEKTTKALRRAMRENKALTDRLRKMKERGQRFEDLVTHLGLSPLIQAVVRPPKGNATVAATAQLDSLKMRLSDMKSNADKEKLHPFVTGLLSRILCQGIVKGVDLATASANRGKEVVAMEKRLPSNLEFSEVRDASQGSFARKDSAVSGASNNTGEDALSTELREKAHNGLTLLELIDKPKETGPKKHTNTDLYKLPQTAATEQWVLRMLKPREVEVLSVLYEQQALRDTLHVLRKEVAVKMKSISEKVDSVQADRVALLDGTSGLIAEVRSLNEILSSNEPHKKNWLPEFTQLVARLVKRLDDLSITASQHKTETLLLKDELESLKSQNKSLQSDKPSGDLTDAVLDGCIPIFPEEMAKNFTETETALYRALLTMQHKLTWQMTDSEEKRLLAADFKTLCTDLVTGIQTTEMHAKSIVAEAKLSEAGARRDNKHYMEMSKTLEEKLEDQDLELLNARRRIRALEAETRRLKNIEEKYMLHCALEEQLFCSTQVTNTSVASSARSSLEGSLQDSDQRLSKLRTKAGRGQSLLGMPSRMSSLRPSMALPSRRSSMSPLSERLPSASAPISGRRPSVSSGRRPSVSALISKRRPSATTLSPMSAQGPSVTSGRRASVSKFTGKHLSPSDAGRRPTVAGRRSSVANRRLSVGGRRSSVSVKNGILKGGVRQAKKLTPAMPVIIECDSDDSSAPDNDGDEGGGSSVRSDSSAVKLGVPDVPAKTRKSLTKKARATRPILSARARRR